MGGLFIQEFRRLVRHRSLWVLPPVAAVVGWAMLPVNADAYLTYIYFDPQGPDELLDNYRTDVWAVYTSGLGWAQLLAMVAGAFLVLRDPRLTGRATRADPGPLIVAKAAVAGLFGVLLAVVDLAVVLPNAQPQLAGHWALAQLRREGVGAHELTLADGSVWTVLLCAFAGVPLFAVLGVGLAARVGRWWLAGGIAGTLTVASLLFMAKDQVWAPAEVVGMVLALPWGLFWYATLSPWAPLAAVLILAVALCNVLLGYAATLRRQARS